MAATAPASVRIVGLTEFRSALRQAEQQAPKRLTAALKKAGVPVAARAGQLAPVRTGRLAASYRARATGATGYITSVAPYGAGAEWGLRKKWSGFAKYGPRGDRFAGRALEQKADEVMAIVTDELQQIIAIYGWAN